MRSRVAEPCCPPPNRRAAVGAVLALALLAALVAGGCKGRSAASGEKSSDEGARQTAQVMVENGQTILVLDAATEQRLGLQVTTLAASAARAQTSLPAVVLSAAPLAKYRADYVAAQAQLGKAQIRAAVAQKEFERLQALSTPEQNVSRKSLEAAQGAWQADEADVSAARAQLDLESAALRQEWGAAVTRWCAADSPELERILSRSDALVQLTIPASEAVRAPQAIRLELPDGKRVAARLVSPFPRVDPRIQGTSFLYVVSGQRELAPGLNLLARIDSGAAQRGVLLPTSAVVWSGGAAWIYQQIAPQRFTRLPAATDLPVDGGYLALHGFASGDKVVTVGAQELLSEEVLLHGGGGGDED